MTASATCYAEGGKVIGFRKSRGTVYNAKADPDMYFNVRTAAVIPGPPCENGRGDNLILEERGVEMCITGFSGETTPYTQAGASSREGSR